jgi:hypothetical protein
LKQLTNTRYGAEDYSFNQAADTLYYSSLTSKGKTLFKIPTASLIGKNVSFADVHKYIVAEKLAEQESALAQSAGEDIVSQTPEIQPIRWQVSQRGAHVQLPFLGSYLCQCRQGAGGELRL